MLIAAVYFCSSRPARAQGDTIRLTSLEKTIAAAVKNNPTQEIYLRQITQASLNYKAARGFLYPNASLGFNGTDNLSLATTPIPGVILGRPGETIYAKFGKHYVYNTGVSLSQDIISWTNVLEMKLARSNIELAHLQREAFLQSLKEQVARLYFSALIAKTALQIDAHDRQLADSVVALSQQKLQEGSTDRMTVNLAAINSNTIAQNQAQSQQLLDQSLENLKILLGGKPAGEMVVADSLGSAPGTPGAPDDEPQALGADRNLVVYRQQQDIAGMQSRSQRSQAYPTITATGFFGDQQFRDDFSLAFGNNAWNAYNYVALNITIPLFTGLTNTYKYRSAVVQKDIAELQMKKAVDESAINDRLLLKNYTACLQMLKASVASFQLYGQNVRLDQQKYSEGLLSLDVYMKAFEDYLTAENTYLNNLSQLLSIQATIISRR
ncbi:MAG TPA: TolC family protein [Puia sp.]|nr:TolC family protein [Puia sp.]